VGEVVVLLDGILSGVQSLLDVCVLVVPQVGSGLVLLASGGGQVAQVVRDAAVVADQHSLCWLVLALPQPVLHAEAVFK